MSQSRKNNSHLDPTIDISSSDIKNDILSKINNLTISQLESILKNWFFTHNHDYIEQLIKLLNISDLYGKMELGKIVWEIMKTLILKRIYNYIDCTDSIKTLSKLLDECALRALFIKCNYLYDDENIKIDLFLYKDILSIFNRYHQEIMNKVSEDLSCLSYLIYEFDVGIKSPEDWDSLEAAEKIAALLAQEIDIRVIYQFYEKTLAGEMFAPWELKNIFFTLEGTPNNDYSQINLSYLNPLKNFYVTGAPLANEAAQKRIESSLESCVEIIELMNRFQPKYTSLIKKISSVGIEEKENNGSGSINPVLLMISENEDIVSAHLALIQNAADRYVATSKKISHFQKIYHAIWRAESRIFKRKNVTVHGNILRRQS